MNRRRAAAIPAVALICAGLWRLEGGPARFPRMLLALGLVLAWSLGVSFPLFTP